MEILPYNVIGMTEFFREPNVYQTATELQTKYATNSPLLSVGCSTGEEVYSLAYLLAKYDHNVKGIDSVSERIDFAKKGLYYTKLEKDIPQVREAFIVTETQNHTTIEIPQPLKDKTDFERVDIALQTVDSVRVAVCANMLIHYRGVDEETKRKTLNIVRNLGRSIEIQGFLVLDGFSALLFHRAKSAQDWILRTDLVTNPYPHNTPAVVYQRI